MRDSSDAIIVEDLSGKIIAWNPGAQKLYGWSEEEALKMAQKDKNYYVNSLCGYCAENIELGDIIDTLIEED